MVDKITTTRKDKLGKKIGALGDDAMVQLNRAIVVFLGLAKPQNPKPESKVKKPARKAAQKRPVKKAAVRK